MSFRRRLSRLPVSILAIAAFLSVAGPASSAQEHDATSSSVARSTSLSGPNIGSTVSTPGHLGALSLEPDVTAVTQSRPGPDGAMLTIKAPTNFRELGSAQVGQIIDTHTLTLRFATQAKLEKIVSAPDFKVEQGGSCVEGNSYEANDTCTLLVRFTPQGPGRRTGKLAVTTSAAVTPFNVGLGGNGYAPTLSFSPSIISTVPGTYVSGAGLLKGALNLAIDGGDALYIADTGNNVIRYIDSSGVIQTASSGTLSAPLGVAVDPFGEIFFDEPAQNAMFEIYDYGSQLQLGGSGTDNCTLAAPCNVDSEKLYLPGVMSIDSYGQLFFVEEEVGAAELTTEPYPGTFYRLYDPFTFQSAHQGVIAVDAYDDIYSYWGITNNCRLLYQTLSDAANSRQYFKTVAGGRTCGFAGDGGQAGSAEMSSQVSQMAFDAAGNLYFSDTGNQRVRRIEAGTGIITTIAGTGATGYSGDGGAATSAALNAPTGVTVDSQGQVYIISSSATSGTAQVIRKVGVVGALNFGTSAVGSPSTAQTVTLLNSGNSNLDFNHVGFSSGNTSDFVLDVNTTTCNFTEPLASGHSCKIGFIFTPIATGSRSAVLSITDDTVIGLNTIQLSGSGATTATLSPSSFSYASTTVGVASSSQTATLTNTGKASIAISSIALSGTNATSFSDTTTCGTTLAAGASCTIAVTFKPTAAGTLTATLTVTDNAVGGRQTLTLSGVGIASAAKPALAPTSLAFSSTTVGATSAVQSIKLSNTGTAALSISSVGMTGTNGTDFVLSHNCGTSVAAGSSCTISVSFKPSAAGTRSGSVSVVSSTGTLTAAATGTAVAAAKAVLSPASLTFASQTVATSSAAKTITLTNSGGVALTISTYTFGGTNATDFSQTHTCSTSLAAAASCTISVVFKPVAAGTRTASLAIATSAGTVTATLSATSVAAAVAPKVTLTSPANPLPTQRMLSLSTRVVGSSATVPTGKVQLMEGGTVLAEGTLSNGSVNFKPVMMTQGAHTLQSIYLGDGKNLSSRSASLVETVGMQMTAPPITILTAEEGASR